MLSCNALNQIVLRLMMLFHQSAMSLSRLFFFACNCADGGLLCRRMFFIWIHVLKQKASNWIGHVVISLRQCLPVQKETVSIGKSDMHLWLSQTITRELFHVFHFNCLRCGLGYVVIVATVSIAPIFL